MSTGIYNYKNNLHRNYIFEGNYILDGNYILRGII